ncbi:MAG TPA: AAA family ATPase [Gemmatimonadaceae bacterium]|nr:AAA family ATPase [Gemmatimonadaceae bacterium]
MSSVSGKPAAVLAYLAIMGPTPRDRVVTLLWSDSDELRARNAFRQTLHRLKAIAGGSLVADVKDSLSLSSDLQVDAEIFRIAAKEGRWREATELYTGEFLQGLVTGAQAFDEWVEVERRRLEAAYTGALDRAATDAADGGDWNTALAYARRLTATDPLNVAGCEREVRLLIRAGMRDQATLIADLHADVISREVGGDAAAGLRQLAARTRASATPPRKKTQSKMVRGPSPFVGRAMELGSLLSLWDTAHEERGGLVLITGPAGIGKTRLLAEFVERARGLGSMRSAIGKERGEWDIPYAGMADALRTIVRAPAVAGASRHLLVEAARLLPELRDRFDLPESGPLRDDAELLRFFEGVSAFVEAVAYDEPLYVQVDDFQRASTHSVQLAAYLVDRLADTPVLFAFALRAGEPGETLPPHISTFLERAAPAGDGRPAATMLGLSALLDSEAEELARTSATTSHDDRLRLVEAARGNPGRLLALARGETQPAANALIPLRTILRERFFAATQQERRLFVVAAFYGKVTPLRLLAAASHLSEPAALEAALSLEDAGLLVQVGFGVTTAHPDAFEMALEGSGPAGTALLAGWAADVLAAEPDVIPADLARLYIASGRGNDAAPYVMRAAMLAAAAGAVEVGVSLLQRTLALPLHDAERSKLEGLLRALGGGRQLLRGKVTPPTPAPTPAPESITDERVRIFASASPKDIGRALWRAFPARYPWASTAGLALVALTIFLAVQTLGTGSRGTGAFLTDTLLVTEATGGRGARVFPVTGALLPTPRFGPARQIGDGTSWLDSIAPPWVNPRLSPNGRLAVVERVTATGANVYVFTRDGRDTIPLATSPGEWLAVGWSPDGAWVLAMRTTRDAATGDVSHLFALEAREDGRVVAIDTAAGRIVSEAVWSPTGDRIAWTARDGRTRHLDVYVASFGGPPVNVSRDPSENYAIAWAPDGGTIGFVSERDGRPQIYSAELEPELRIRRLTHDAAAHNNPAFSPDGRQLAFESTRGGHLGVWLTTTVGGAPQRITPPDRSFALTRWQQAGPNRHIERIAIDGPSVVSVGDTFAFVGRILDQHGAAFVARYVEWEVEGDAVAALPRGTEDRDANRVLLVARATGRIRIRATVGAWRAGQRVIVVTRPSIGSLADDFERPPLSARWQSLGRSTPTVVSGFGEDSTRGLSPMGGRPWASGALSRDVLLLRPGFVLRVWVRAPFDEVGEARSFTLAIVDDDDQLPADSVAPQPFKAAHVTWAGEGGRLVFGAGREATSEPTSASGTSRMREIAIAVEAGGIVRFTVDGATRWRSSARVFEPAVPPRRVRVWLGSINTGSAVIFDNVRASAP